MRKFVLFAFAALAAMTANAQKFNQKSVVMAQKFHTMKYDKAAIANSTFEFKKAGKPSLNASAFKAPDLNSIYGNYIEDQASDVHECYATVIKDSLYVDHTTGESFHLVNISLLDGLVNVLGEYDEATGIIDCPAFQYCGYDAEVDSMFITGMTDDFKTMDELSFQVNDDGSISLNQPNYVILIPNYGDGSLAYTFGISPSYYPMNGIQMGYENGNRTGGAWTVTSYPVAIEDFGSAINLYGFCGVGMISLDVNEDNTISIPTGQPLLALSSRQDPDGVYGGAISLWGVTLGEADEEGHRTITTDFEMTEVKGYIDVDTIKIDGDNLFRLMSKVDAEGLAYGIGWFQDTWVVNIGGHFIATGIEEINATREEKEKNAKTYNLMGQQVNRATKGLVIRNGKKFLNK